MSLCSSYLGHPCFLFFAIHANNLDQLMFLQGIKDELQRYIPIIIFLGLIVAAVNHGFPSLSQVPSAEFRRPSGPCLLARGEMMRWDAVENLPRYMLIYVGYFERMIYSYLGKMLCI